MILLTEEEILKIQDEYKEESIAVWDGMLSRDEKVELAFALFGIPQRVAKAQLKKVVEYLCTLDFYDDWGGESGKAVRDKIMQALLKETE